MHVLKVLVLIWNIQNLPKGIYNPEFHSLSTQLLTQGVWILCSLPHQVQVWLFMVQQCMTKREITMSNIHSIQWWRRNMASTIYASTQRKAWKKPSIVTAPQHIGYRKLLLTTSITQYTDTHRSLQRACFLPSDSCCRRFILRIGEREFLFFIQKNPIDCWKGRKIYLATIFHLGMEI